MKIQEKLLMAWRVFTLFFLFLGLGAITGGYSDHAGWTIALSLLFSLLSLWGAMRKKANLGWATVYGLTWGLLAVLYYAVLPVVKDNKRL